VKTCKLPCSDYKKNLRNGTRHPALVVSVHWRPQLLNWNEPVSTTPLNWQEVIICRCFVTPSVMKRLVEGDLDINTILASDQVRPEL